MKALITGANGGIGSATARKLAQSGYEILTLKSRFEDPMALQKECELIARENEINALILCAGTAKFAPLAAFGADEIERIVSVNLTANLIIVRSLLTNLARNGAHVVGIASIEAVRASRFSAVYSASKAGLRAFLLCLFEEERKRIRVTCIEPDIVNTPFYDNLSFAPAPEAACYVDAEEIAKFTLEVLRTKSNVSELVIRPRVVGIKKRPHGGI